jgi:hypothetical protein
MDTTPTNLRKAASPAEAFKPRKGQTTHPHRYRTKVNKQGANPAARIAKKARAIALPASPLALPERSVAPQPAKSFKPSNANSAKLIQEQATDPLPPTLNELPPYRHIFIGAQFEQLYTPVYKEIDIQAQARYTSRTNIPCERLGRHLIFNGFALARDFITSPEVREKAEFQDREALAIEILKKLYTFTIAKMDASKFKLEDFVHVNLLMALLVDWRKGLIGELEFSTDLTSEKVLEEFQKLSAEEQNANLRLSSIFKKINKSMDLKAEDLKELNIFHDLICENLFNLKSDMHRKIFRCESCTYYPKDLPVVTPITATNQYTELPKYQLFCAYTNCRSGIGETSFINTAYEMPDAILTTFDPKINFETKIDETNTSLRFTPTSNNNNQKKYSYSPHNNRLSTAVNLAHDAAHWTLTRHANRKFEKKIRVPLNVIFYDVYHLTKNNNLSSNDLKIMRKILFFFLHEFPTLKSVAVRDRFLEKSLFDQFLDLFKSTKTDREGKFKKPDIENRGWKAVVEKIQNEIDFPDMKNILCLCIENSKNLMSGFYSWNNHTDEYKLVYRDLELMLHEEIMPSPEDGEKKFTYKPLKDEDGRPLLPTFQELFDEGLNGLNAISKSKKRAVLRSIEEAPTLREKWKAIPKEIRNDVKSKALSDGYRRFFETAWDIIKKNIPDEEDW